MIQKIKESENEHISHQRGPTLVSLRMQNIKAQVYRLYKIKNSSI